MYIIIYQKLEIKIKPVLKERGRRLEERATYMPLAITLLKQHNCLRVANTNSTYSLLQTGNGTRYQVCVCVFVNSLEQETEHATRRGCVFL